MDEKERKKATYALKSKLIDDITAALDNGLSMEEIIGTFETIKHQASSAMAEMHKTKPNDRNTIGYR
jgi:hypothetical protein